MTQGNDMVLELSQRIEVVTCEDSSSPRKPPATPLASDHRPLDDLAPASDPIHFPKPSFARGRRAEVLCYIPQTGDHKVVQALFRDLDEADKPMAYAPVPGKRPIKTIMGHVEICVVLEPCCMDESQSDDDESNGDDEMVFQSTNQYVAVKVNDCERMDQLKGQHAEDPLQEIAAMQLAQAHPNVLGIIEVLFDGKSLNVVLPYCDKGDLFQVLQDYSMQSDAPGMPEGQVRYWFRQVLAGVRHLHAVGICHRDLSPENVMIRGTQGVVIDLGMALRVPYEDEKGAVVDVTRGRKRRWIKPQGACGKLPYMSPEIYRNRQKFDGAAADVWTLGTILFCMVTGNRSYQRPHRSDPQYYWMTEGLTQLLSDWQVDLSPEGVHLLQNLLQVDPRLRLTLEEVDSHPWFSMPDEQPTL